MPLIKPAAQDWPALAGWLVPNENCTTVGYAIIQRAFEDVGILEVPIASNRGVRIERYLRRAGVPEDIIAAGKGWWCAAFVGAVYADCGVPVPRDYASCDAWLPYVEDKPAVGHAVLYGVRGDAHHIGIVARLDPMVLTIEGNRAFAGTTNNGVACDLGPMMRKDVLGYVNPQALIARYNREKAA
jgi:hypothetical protein